MALSINSKVTLNNGVEMPYFGLGAYALRSGMGARQAVRYALEVGYRKVDTAAFYDNERQVGQGVRESGIPREEVFVITKVWNGDQGYESTLRAFERSAEALDLGPIDLYLIHWPLEGKREQTWRALAELYEQGKCRAIGVSNYTIQHLEALLEESAVVPAVNQVEFNPFVYQRDLLAYCQEHGILLEAYSPLTKGRRLSDPTLTAVADKYGKTSAQILIRWALQHGVAVIPKSARKARIRENAAVFDFEIGEQDMARLDALDQSYRVSWDPSNVP